MPNCIFQLFRNWKKWELATFAKLSASLFVNFSFILRPFLLERRKLPLCELQLILWLEKTLQHVITVKELTLKKVCRRTWVWCLWISMKICAVIEMFSTILSRHHQKFWKKIMRKECFNFTWAEFFYRTSYDNPEPKLYLLKNRLNRKKLFSF